jgi:hypothetical protein
MPQSRVVDYARRSMPMRRSMSSMCGHDLVLGLTRTVSSILPAPFKIPAADGTVPRAVVSAGGVGAPLPPGTRICAPAKARC